MSCDNCLVWKEKYVKLKDSKRILKDGMKVQNQTLDNLLNDNQIRKKAIEEEKKRADAESQEKLKESAKRVSLEKEIGVLKMEIKKLQQEERSKSEAQDVDRELMMLRTRDTEKGAEIDKLKELVEAEKVRADAERHEKCKESATRALLEKEIDVLKTEIHTLQQIEGSKSKAQDVDRELMLLQTRHTEKEAEIDKLKELVEAEKVQADAERHEKCKESATRALLEKEIDVLKTEIHTLQQIEGSKSKAQDVARELMLLQTCHTEKEAEIDKLKELVEAEKVRADAERHEKRKESATRALLEKEIDVLKTEIPTLQQKEGSNSKAQDVHSELLLLQSRGTEMEAEIGKLNDLVDEAKARAEAERLEKSKESAIRVSAEKENDVLRAEIQSLHKREGSKSMTQDSELILFRTRQAEMEAEIDKLKKLVEKERMKTDCEKKKAGAEKMKATKVHEALKAEKVRTDEARKVADNEQKKVEESRILLEKFKSEAELARSQLVTEASKSEDTNNKLELERRKVLDEKRRVDVEMDKLKKQVQLAGVHQKKAMDEKCRADHLSQQLEEHKRRIQTLEKQVQENASLRKSEEALANSSDKFVNSKSPKMSKDVRLDNLGRSPDESKLVLDDLKSEKVYERLREEKLKVTREMKRADSEMNRADQFKKAAQVNKSKALEEKSRADHLARQLQDHANFIELLKKEVAQLTPSKSFLEASVNTEMNSKTAELEMMRRHLKLKTKQVKHAKEVAELERDRRDMLQQKLGTITHEFVQFLQRINVLEDCFNQHTEGRENSNKCTVINSSDLNLRRELLRKYPNQVQFHQDVEPVKTNFLALDATGTSKQVLNCSGGNSAQCISGIDFKLDTLLSCPERKMLESSAINSTMASFSDRQLMASQGKDALTVTNSAKLSDGNSNSQSKLASLMKTRSNKSPKHSKKRKVVTNAAKCVDHSYSEGKKCQVRVEGKLSNLDGILKSQMDKSLLDKSNFEQHPEQNKAKKRKKDLSVEEVALQLFADSNNHKEKIGEESEETNVYNKIIVPDKNIGKAVRACEDGLGDFGSNGQEMECLMELIQGNYMKLLDLDNAVDEDRYRKAVERPLSPFIPVVEFQSSVTTVPSSCNHQGDPDMLFTGKNKLVLSCCHEVVNMDIDKPNTCHTGFPNDPSPPKIDNFVGVPVNVRDIYKCEGSAIYEDTASAQHIRESHKMTEFSDLCGSSNNVTLKSCQTFPGITSFKTPKYCVVFSDNDHESSISRIYHGINICINWCSMTLEMDERMLKLILGSLKMEDLSPRERVSVVFSVLLNFSETALEIWKSWPANIIKLSDFFARCLHTVLSDSVTQSCFAELCFAGELLRLIEEFLLDRKLLVPADISPEASPVTGFRVNILSNEKHTTLSQTLASRHQLLPGSVILASICAVIDRIGFLCEVSYNILRFLKPDNLLVLDILHAFAYVCGPKYFALEDYSLTMTVVRSLVTILGKQFVSRGHACCLPAVVEVKRKFPSCTKCPFSEAALSIDEVISLLFGKLQNYVLSGVITPVVRESHENITHYLEARDSIHMTCSTNCCLNKFGIASLKSTSVHDGNFCDFMDVVALVELVASKMHWDWTCDKVVPPMLKVLDLCDLGHCFTGVIIFIGKLGRLGVDANGYDDKGVESLRSRLAALLYQNSLKEVAFTSQIVVINALIGITPLNFEKLLKTNDEIPLAAKYFKLSRCVRNWYSALGSEQQSLSLGLLMSASEPSGTVV